VFFSLSDSKLIPYMLPVFPAIAVLVALLPPPAWARDLRITSVASLIFGAALAIGAVAMPAILSSTRNGQVFLTLRWPLLGGGVLLLAGSGLALWRRRLPDVMATALACAWFGMATLLLVGARGVEPLYSGARLMPVIDSLGGRDPRIPVYSVRTYDQTLTFYLARPVTLVAYRGELDFGITLEPTKGIDTLESFTGVWTAAPQALAIMSENTYQTLQQRGLPMVRQASDLRRVVVSRR
jgi:4-amino-4-deoxy-L-arabinose transferase-like glycosyltransferase